MGLIKINIAWWKRFKLGDPEKTRPPIPNAQQKKKRKKESQITEYPRATNELAQTPKESILVPTATQLRHECPKSDKHCQNRPKYHQRKSPVHTWQPRKHSDPKHPHQNNTPMSKPAHLEPKNIPVPETPPALHTCDPPGAPFPTYPEHAIQNIMYKCYSCSLIHPNLHFVLECGHI